MGIKQIKIVVTEKGLCSTECSLFARIAGTSCCGLGVGVSVMVTEGQKPTPQCPGEGAYQLIKRGLGG